MVITRITVNVVLPSIPIAPVIPALAKDVIISFAAGQGVIAKVNTPGWFINNYFPITPGGRYSFRRNDQAKILKPDIVSQDEVLTGVACDAVISITPDDHIPAASA